MEPSIGGVGPLQLTGGREKVGLLHNNQLCNQLWWAGSVVVRYKHVATYFCAQIVLEKSLYMGMSMVKALIVKVLELGGKKLPLMLCACICIKQARNSC